MSVLNRATNTTINGGVFNLNATQLIPSVGRQSNVSSVLLDNSATAGLLDAEERFDAPKCTDGTRELMLQEMKSFTLIGTRPAVYWLHGPAGVGKSALCQSLGLALREEGNHAASFFFSRSAPGRNDGGKLIATLACQLALNIPLMKPILAKAIRENPFVFKATNDVKMQTLIVDPINQLRKRFRWNPRTWARKLAGQQLHPRLIIVDGLDECHDSEVQRDLILCIGRAVRQIALPFRFVVASRPESHILATFELDPIFQGPRGVELVTKNLGYDEDADRQITTFLLKEFAEIRRTHPIRDYLPENWPLPTQVTQLVAKSSKGFIYPATVIRYIRMPENRPDQCLERILGLSDLPASDKPYEPIDVLYRHIFDSVPKRNQEAVRKIFHFLVVPNNLNGLITPRFIEMSLGYPPGHVQHVLCNLLCIVAVANIDGPITILHASLPDFLLDPLRSGPKLHIKLANACDMVIKAIHMTLDPSHFTTAIDVLYHYIFDSVPCTKTQAVHNIFHFLFVPKELEGLITPRLIEKFLHYPRGRVQRILRDLYSIVRVAEIDQPITILYASLRDFLLDPQRSGLFHIKLGDAHATVIAAIHKTVDPAHFTKAIDVLYNYIFDSVPRSNKQAVQDIFHLLFVPNELEGLITPRLIERFLGYPHGHVQHILQDLYYIVRVAEIDQPITILYASLRDFLLDPQRSGLFHIKLGDAHATVIAAIHKTVNPAHFTKPMDVLYRRIFDSIAWDNKATARKILHFLVAPPYNLKGVITPRLIEKSLSFPRGHVKYILQDLHCFVLVAEKDQPISVRHASLRKFLLDPKRSGWWAVHNSGIMHVDVGK